MLELGLGWWEFECRRLEMELIVEYDVGSNIVVVVVVFVVVVVVFVEVLMIVE